MPLRDGKKYACESCIRGHRVSNCQHSDRPLKLIPPKGRPVKQCEHCRTARKSKSHHGQCDCGSKKEKKKEEKADIKVDSGCCCHKGESCACGKTKSELLRLERSLKRPTQPVKSKACHSSSGSESKISFGKGIHKPVHRNNNMAHTSGAPYTRPVTLHGYSQFANSKRDTYADTSRASDDLWLGRHRSISPAPLISRTNSEESLEEASSISFDFDQHFAKQANIARARSEHTLDTVNENATEPLSFADSSRLSYSQDDFLAMANMSPNFAPQYDWPVTSSAFSPSDLPLTSQLAEFAPSNISQSAESTYMAGPGLTTTSSLTHDSESEHFPEFWSDTISLRNNSSDERWLQTASRTNGMKFSPRQLPHTTSHSALHFSSMLTASDADAGNASIIIPSQPDFAEDQADWQWETEFSPTAQHHDVSKDLNWLF